MTATELEATLRKVRVEILAMADRQDDFAEPKYHHFTEESRVMYRHAAKMLRMAAAKFPKESQ